MEFAQKREKLLKSLDMFAEETRAMLRILCEIKDKEMKEEDCIEWKQFQIKSIRNAWMNAQEDYFRLMCEFEVLNYKRD